VSAFHHLTLIRRSAPAEHVDEDKERKGYLSFDIAIEYGTAVMMDTEKT